MRPFTV